MSSSRPDSSSALIVYVIVLLSLQVFLLVVALDGLLAREPRLAWTSAAVSLVLFAGSWLFHRWAMGKAVLERGSLVASHDQEDHLP